MPAVVLQASPDGVRVELAVGARRLSAFVPRPFVAQARDALLASAADAVEVDALPQRGDRAALTQHAMRAVGRLAGPKRAADALPPTRMAVDDLAERAVGRPFAATDEIMEPVQPFRDL